MEETVLSRFITLVEMDQRAQHLRRECLELTSRQQELEQEIRLLYQTLEQAQLTVRTLQKKGSALDLELKSVDSQLRDKKQRLINALSPREFFSLEQEIALLEQKLTEQESILFTLWQDQDQAQTTLSQVQKMAPEKIAQLQATLERICSQKEYLSTQVQAYQENRESYTRNIDTTLLSQYEHMKATVENPVTTMAQESCTSCFYPLSKHDVSLIKQDTLVTCKGCYRLLYLPKAQSGS